MTGSGTTRAAGVAYAETVRAAITQVLHSPSFARAASAVQAEIAAMPSVERRAAELVARVESVAA